MVLWFALWLAVGLGLALGQTGVFPARRGAPAVSVWQADTGRLVVMDLEEYVAGVVAAEMPALFHPEALKAQAVAARTYAVRAIGDGRSVPEEPRAALSTASGQAWASASALRQRWGGEESFQAYWGRIAAAVEATRGQVLTYRGRVIQALYHAASGGHTESSEHYFASAQPYLQGVEDPYEPPSPHGLRSIVMPRRKVYEALGVPPDTPAPALQVVERTPSGRARHVRAGHHLLSGRAVRERLGLPSTWFDVEEGDDTVTWLVRGYGHGVGMSQYGAEGMARAGFTHEAILRHYYRGTGLTRMY